MKKGTPLQADQIAEALEELALLLELKGENPFKVRAHENAARILRSTDTPIDELLTEAAEGRVKGIGEHLLEKITSLHRTGKLPALEKLRKEFPRGILELTKVPGLGPKKVKELYKRLKVSSLEDLEKVSLEGKIAKLTGFGEKSQEKILAGLAQIKKYSGSYLLRDALTEARKIIAQLQANSAVKEISEGGSLRRRKEIVGDIDILVSSDKPKTIIKLFVTLPQVASITAQGETRAAVVLQNGIAVDLRVVAPDEYPAALQYFTGNKEHNTVLRSRAIERGLKLNEYGLFRGTRRIKLRSEDDIYRQLELVPLPPEIREEQGEIEFAEKYFREEKAFPTLVERSDLRGVLHMHSKYSDGANTIEEMAKAAKKLGFEYIGITDHSQSAAYAGGLSPERVREQHREIDQLNKKLAPFRIFKGIESDILADGSLDYSADVLKHFDFVIASIHSRFSLDEKEMTERIIKAVTNPFTTILGHPTGRLLLKRDAYQVDLRAVIDAAAKSGTAIELNCNPLRMDLDWRLLRRAKELGVLIPISPDAHSTEELTYLDEGIGVARKGWLTKSDVLNTLTTSEIEKWFQRRRASKK